MERLQLIMKRIFGVKHAGIYFKTIITIEDNYLYHKGKRYTREDIIAIKRGDDLLASFMRYPSSTVLLRDGVILRIPVTLQEKNVHDSIRFAPFGRETKSYDELIDILEKNSSANEALAHGLYSYNYIMVYRWLIIMGFLFGVCILLAVLGLKLRYDFVIVFVTAIQVISMGSGILLLANRHLKEYRLLKELRSAIPPGRPWRDAPNYSNCRY